MERFSEERAVEGAARLLDRWISGEEARVEKNSSSSGLMLDGVIRLGAHAFALEVKSRLSATAFDSAFLHLKTHAPGGSIPLLVVPFMSEAGRKRCREAEVAWLDLSGNADISAPGLRILVSDQANKFKRPGRVSTAFAPKGARVARFLLQNGERPHTQGEIVQGTHSSVGHVSKIVTKLLADRLVERDSEGRIRVPDADRLLDAWAQEYDFGKHRRTSCSVASRTGEETTFLLAERLRKRAVPYAATGLSAAYCIEPFANYRIATLYVDAVIDETLLDDLEVREADRGWNLWLVEPNDAGVFEGAHERQGIVCAHPLQVYLDLLGHPERAKEAAEHLRKHSLKGGLHGI